MNQLISAFTLFLSLLVEAIPFLMLGVLLSGLLLLFVDERKLIAILPKNPVLGALVGSLAGFLFPVCECGNIPVARRLITQGAPASVAIGFLLAAPTINPIVIFSTYTAFRDQPEIVVLRIGMSLAIATIVGAIFSVQKDLRPLLQPNLAIYVPTPKSSPPQTKSGSKLPQTGTFFLGQTDRPLELETLPLPTTSVVEKPFRDRLHLLLDNTIAEMRELGSILVLGSAVAAAIQVWVPRDIILSLGQGPISSIVAMMILAAVVSICSTVDSFFALSFSATFTSGSLLSFLVFGPMIDLKAIGLVLTIFKKRTVVYLFLLSAQMTFLGCLFVNFQIR
ncbi:permease [Tumidithrix helvetica PCC 7403]|uniref:permease n=1 Tax=Tumidithrix helvetica TaxID=3457545 RepID=UPI003C93CEB4